MMPRKVGDKVNLSISSSAIGIFVIYLASAVTTALEIRFKWFLEFSEDHLFIKIPGFFILVGASFFVGRLMVLEFERRCNKTWWDPSNSPDGPISWMMVLRLTVGEGKLDPLNLTRASGIRVYEAFFFGCVLASALVSLLCVLIACLRFLAVPHVPTFFLIAGQDGEQMADAAMNLSGNLTAILALFAAAVSIYFTYQQLKAKVRADNRQAWIAKLRTLISEAVALGAAQATASMCSRQKIWRKLDPLRLELELMLNPSERDHRLLMYLIRRLSLLDRCDLNLIHDAENLRTVIENDPNVTDQDFEQWKIILDCQKPVKLVSYAMRLSHIVLKREWERVKAIR